MTNVLNVGAASSMEADAPETSRTKAPAAAVDRFNGHRLGMFIHYGLYSVHGRGAWTLANERMPLDQYMMLADHFQPHKDASSHWAKLATRAGMKYACLTTRHHEGYCLFPTSTKKVHAGNSGPQRDVVRDYVEAFRDAGIDVSLYYSVADWSDPDWRAGPFCNPRGWSEFVERVHDQLRQLMSDYGPISYLFYDHCPPPELWGCDEINAEMRSLQPDLLISNRCERDEDVASAEQTIKPDLSARAWEACCTINSSWAYNSGDDVFKTPHELVRMLMMCTHNGGNLLLNVGPMADGRVQPEAIERLDAVGQWLERNGDAIYHTTGAPFNYVDQHYTSARDNTAYLALPKYHGPRSMIAGVGCKVLRAYTLTDRAEVAFKQEGNRVLFTGLPEKSPDPLMTVVAIELDGKPKGVPHPIFNPDRFVPPELSPDET